MVGREVSLAGDQDTLGSGTDDLNCIRGDRDLINARALGRVKMPVFEGVQNCLRLIGICLQLNPATAKIRTLKMGVVAGISRETMPLVQHAVEKIAPSPLSCMRWQP